MSEAFNDWLIAAVEVAPQERDRLLARREQPPGARQCHPPGAEEHLIALIVVAGAAGDGGNRKVFSDTAL